MRAGRYERIILARIDRRTCTRGEWHALRRWRSAHARGIMLPDVALMGAVTAADFRRAMEAFAVQLRRAFATPSGRSARMRFGGSR